VDIIEKAITIEGALDSFIIKYFVCELDKQPEFLEKVLSEKFFTLGPKIMIFRNIDYHHNPKFKGEYDGLVDSLLRIDNIRNYAAHAAPASIVTPMLLKAEKGKFSKVTLEVEYKEFMEKYNLAFSSLVRLIEELRKEK